MMPAGEGNAADFGTFDPILYQLENEGESDGNEAEGEGEEVDLANIPDEERQHIMEDLQNLRIQRNMDTSNPPLPTQFRSSTLSRAIRRMASGGGRGRPRRRTDENSIKFDNLFGQLQTESIDDLKNTIAMLNTEICMSNESMKRAMRPERFVKPLLSHLENGLDSALMLSCSNCLLTIIDIFPEVSETIITQKGLKILEEKGKKFEYIDVAED